jgi:hypothetical protein
VEEAFMASSKELRVWATTLRRWSASVENDPVREQMVRLSVELDRLAECKEVAERQLV